MFDPAQHHQGLLKILEGRLAIEVTGGPVEPYCGFTRVSEDLAGLLVDFQRVCFHYGTLCLGHATMCHLGML